jgi:adenylate cyclase
MNSSSKVSGLESAVMLGLFARFRPAGLRLSVMAAIGLVCILVLSIFRPSLSGIEERIGVLGWTVKPDLTPEERITLVVVDEASIAEVGPWPWTRAKMAELVDAINDAGAQMQLHDITYPESREGDEELISSINRASNTVISQVPVLRQQPEHTSVGLMSHPIAGAFCDSSVIKPFTTSQFVASASIFAGVPKGHNAALFEADGAVRKSPAVVCVDGEAFPSLALAAFLQLGSSSEWRGSIRSGASLLEPHAILTMDGYPGLEVPLDDSGAMRISFAASPAAFRAVSAVDVLTGRIDKSILENVLVIVGGTAFGMGDIVPTPYSGGTYGVELQARLLASVLDADVPFTPLGASLFQALLCVAFGIFLYQVAGVRGRVAAYGLPIAAILLPTIAVLIHAWLLSEINMWLGWVIPALFGVLAASSLLLVELGLVRFERARVYGNLNSYLPSSVAQEIAFSLPSSNVNAHRIDATLLCADLRNFSAYSESRPPEEIAALLHFFISRVTEIVEAQGGQIQEFRGDGVLAFWSGANTAIARRALRAAEILRDSVSEQLLDAQSPQGLEPLALGIGVEQGPVLVGSIGPAHRRSHTMLGDTVGITLRIQEMTSELAQSVLVGECLARQVDHSGLESQGSYLLPGLRIPHVLFAPSSVANISTIHPKLSVVGGGKP